MAISTSSPQTASDIHLRASPCGIRPRCRSPSTTTGISRGAFADKPEWQRWGCETGDWELVERGLSRYQTESASGDAWAELRYRNLVPEPEQWEAVLERPGRFRANLRSTLSPTFTRTTPTCRRIVESC